MPDIVFVNEKDEVIGTGPKEEAFAKGIRHRIVRVFIFNSKGEMFVQKRSKNLRLAPGKWDQSVGGHVDVGEDYLEAAIRETEEEVGLKNVRLKKIGKFYVGEELKAYTLNRFNMLYTATHDGELRLNEGEIDEGKWIGIEDLEQWMEERPEDLTPGFITAYKFYKENS